MRNALCREILRNLAAALMTMMVVVGLILAALTIDAKRRGIESPFPQPAADDLCCSPARGSFRQVFDTGNSIPVYSPGARSLKRLRVTTLKLQVTNLSIYWSSQELR